VLAIWASGILPACITVCQGLTQTKIPMLFFFASAVRLQNLCSESLTGDGYSVVIDLSGWRNLFRFYWRTTIICISFALSRVVRHFNLKKSGHLFSDWATKQLSPIQLNTLDNSISSSIPSSHLITWPTLWHKLYLTPLNNCLFRILNQKIQYRSKVRTTILYI